MGKDMKSRQLVLIKDILLFLGLGGILSGSLVDYPPILYAIFRIAFSDGLLISFFCAHCPTCHKWGLNPRFWASNAGICKHCGQQIEYWD